MRGISFISGVSVLALSALLINTPAQAKSFSASDFKLTLKDDDTLEIGYGSSSILIDAGGAWDSVEDAAGKTYSYSGPITIGEFSIGDVDASIGPDGVKLVTPAGFGLGDLTLSAAELAFELLPGDQIADQPDFLTFDSKDFVLYTAISTGLEFGIGDDVSISIPTPVDVAASLAVEVKNGSLYFEGPIPSPTMLANGVNKLIKSATSGSKSDNGNILTGGFGFSVDKDFTYTSDVDVYQSSKKDADQEKFSADVVLVGQFDLADMASVDGTFFLDAETGKTGVNAGATISFDVMGASVSLSAGSGSFVVDEDGVRLGLNLDADDDWGLPSDLDYIAHFLSPVLGTDVTANGTLNTGGDFILALTVDSMDMFGISLSDGLFRLSSSGLDVAGKLDIDGIGKVQASGTVTDANCYLDIEKFKFLSFDLGNPKIKPCDMAEDAALAFVGDIKIMGYTLSAVDGTAYATDAAKAFLSKKQSFSVDFDVKETFGISGGLGGYVKLASSGNANMTLATNGVLSGSLKPTSSAKFCGKVKFAGKKVSKCKKVSSGFSQDFDAKLGCITFKADATILNTKLSIDAGKVCPWPDTGSYKASSDYDSTDALGSDDLGTTLALKTSGGKYVKWQSSHGALTTTSTVNDYIGFTLVNFDDSKCLQDGSVVAIRQGDEDATSDDWYMRVYKDKYSALDGAAGDYGDGKKKFYIGKVKMAGTCLSDGDVITLKNREYNRYWSDSNGTIVATNDKDDSNFTVVFDPGWE